MSDLADQFVMACLPPPDAHRAGSLDHARSLLASDCSLATSSDAAALVTGQVEAIVPRITSGELAPNEPIGPNAWSPLLYVCFSMFERDDRELRENFHAIANALLSAGADPNAFFIQGDEKETALYGATGVANDAELGRLLLDAGADVNDADAAYHIAEHDNLASVELLFQRGLSADLRATTLLHRLDYNDLDSIRTILALGADPNGRGQWGKTPLHQAIMRGRSLAFIDLLIEHGADVHALREDGRSAFALAARSGQKETVERLRELGADETLNDSDELLAACALEEPERAFAIVIGDPSRVSKMSDDELAAIVDAARDGRTESVRLMLEAGIPIETRGTCGATALHWAAWHGRAATVQLLLDRHASVTARCTAYQTTPLGWAVYGSTAVNLPQGDYVRTVQVLLEAGSEVRQEMLAQGTDEVRRLLQATGN